MRKELKFLLKEYPELSISRTRRHYRLTDPNTGDFVVAACTASDHRAEHNLRAALKRLRAGYGYLARNLQTTNR